MVVVDGLDKGLDLAAFLLARLGHAAGDGKRVALDAGDEGVGEGVGFGAGVNGLDYDDLWVGGFLALYSLLFFAGFPFVASEFVHFVCDLWPSSNSTVRGSSFFRMRSLAEIIVPSFRRNGHG